MTDMTRRDVLRIGAAGIAAAGLTRTAWAQQPANDDALRLGCIGVGHRGQGLLDALLRLKGHRVVAICDINDHFRTMGVNKVKEKQGHAPDEYANGPDDFLNLLDRNDIDGVVVATPCYEHARMFLAAIARGKHMYGEKPMALSVADADAIVVASKQRRDLVIQVGFQWMANPTMCDAIARVHGGQIGTPIEGRFHRHNAKHVMGGWFGRRSQSGDWMLEQACHEYNIMGWVARATPIRAYGMGRNDLHTDVQPERNVTDYYAAILEYPDGMIVHYAHGWISPKGFTGMSMQVIGADGAVDIGAGRIALHDEKAKVEPIAKRERDDTELALEAFLNSIREGKPAVAPVSNGRNAVLTGLLVRKAVYERRCVSWGEMLRTC
jgi:myo-inositol 2-dehydrogenase/D-chiro-inositol 1-dehydrogenase